MGKRGPMSKYAEYVVPALDYPKNALPVGSIPAAIKPFRRFYNRRRAEDIAIEAAMHLLPTSHSGGPKYPLIESVVTFWHHMNPKEKKKKLALDFVVEACGMKRQEFIALILTVLYADVDRKMRSTQLAALPDLLDTSLDVSRTTNPKFSRERMAHLQKANLLPSPPSTSVHVEQVINQPTTTNQTAVVMPTPEEFALKLDAAMRAGREQQQLPPADLSNAIDAEIITESVTDEHAEVIAEPIAENRDDHLPEVPSQLDTAAVAAASPD